MSKTETFPAPRPENRLTKELAREIAYTGYEPKAASVDDPEREAARNRKTQLEKLVVASDTANTIEAAFHVYGDQILTEEDGSQVLTMYVQQHRGEWGKATYRRSIGDNGEIDVVMDFKGVGWGAAARLHSEPGMPPQMEVGSRSKDGVFMLSKYQDSDLVSIGQYWAKNLLEGTPQKPRLHTKMLGKMMLIGSATKSKPAIGTIRDQAKKGRRSFPGS